MFKLRLMPFVEAEEKNLSSDNSLQRTGNRQTQREEAEQFTKFLRGEEEPNINIGENGGYFMKGEVSAIFVDALAKSMDTLIRNDGIRFHLTITPYETPAHLIEPEFSEYETRVAQRTGTDIEKYDRCDPLRFMDEVNEMVEDGRDYLPECNEHGATTDGMTVAQQYLYFVGCIKAKQDKGLKPSFWDIRLAATAVMQLRAGFNKAWVHSSKTHTSEGLVCDAASDGSQVRLLFQLPPLGADKYANQLYLARHSAQWFNIEDGSCTTPDAPFTMTLKQP